MGNNPLEETNDSVNILFTFFASEHQHEFLTALDSKNKIA